MMISLLKSIACTVAMAAMAKLLEKEEEPAKKEPPSLDEKWPYDLRPGFENGRTRNVTIWKDDAKLGRCQAADPESGCALQVGRDGAGDISIHAPLVLIRDVEVRIGERIE